MPATSQDIEHYRGDDKRINIAIRNSDGSQASLSGATVKWWMGKNANSKDANVLIKKDTSDGVTLALVDDVWIAQIALDPEDTQDIKPGQYYHELAVIDASAEEYTVTTGGFAIVATLIPPA